MKRLFQLVIAATIICDATVLTSCSNNDNEPVTPDLKVAEKIIGKWIVADIGGKPVMTNDKSVYTFVSATKAYMSVSINPRQGEEAVWNEQKELDVAISGNKMTLTNRPDAQTTMVEEFNFTAIDDKEFTANHKITVTAGSNVALANEGVIHFTKVTSDFSAAIIGTWQGHCTSEGSVYDDGQEHQWQFLADGKYVYYAKDGEGNWMAYNDEVSQYFVDGSLFCSRWGNGGVYNREWWEISIANGKMNWTALRANEDGSTFTATFEMTKVN